MSIPLFSADDRRAALVVVGVASTILVLGVLLAHHLSPCHPRNIGRCGLRLATTLQGLDGLDGLDDARFTRDALCPSLTEAVDCFYWFSQRCLPARDQRFYSTLYVDGTAALHGLCGSAEPLEGPLEEASPVGPQAPLLVAWGSCLRDAIGRRAHCAQQLEPASLVDSVYDPDATGVFQRPLCRAMRELVLCGLQLVGEHCGLDAALHLQALQDNLTSLVFSVSRPFWLDALLGLSFPLRPQGPRGKCEPDLRPVLAVAEDKGAGGADFPPVPRIPALTSLDAAALSLGAALLLALLIRWLRPWK